MEILEAIADRSARVCVIGLGYVGLPLATAIAEAGFRVTGVDTDREHLRKVRAGMHPPGLELADSPAAVAGSDVVLICVPTPIKDDLPDTTHIEEAAGAIARYLRPGMLVVLESTSYPGTTDGLMRSILEQTGLVAGEDFLLGFSPERIDPGNLRFGISNTPKVVGGLNAASTEAMAAFYACFVDRVVPVSSPSVAEMAKLLENTYRHVNIALTNEMAILCNELGIDVWEVIDAAGTKPFGFQVFYPGPGWGGHCIPVDPAYLSWRVREMGNTARFVELATEFNRRMPAYVVRRMSEALAPAGKELSSSSVVVLGVAYKPETQDCRHSPAIDIIRELLRLGARVQFHDPFVASIRTDTLELEGAPLTDELLEDADLVLLHTAHRAFDAEHIAGRAQLIFDSRNYFRGAYPNVVRL